jgi:hypothetical protein
MYVCMQKFPSLNFPYFLHSVKSFFLPRAGEVSDYKGVKIGMLYCKGKVVPVLN